MIFGVGVGRLAVSQLLNMYVICLSYVIINVTTGFAQHLVMFLITQH